MPRARRPDLRPRRSALVAGKGLKAAVATALPPGKAAEQVTERREGDTLEARSTSRRIRTVDDLLRHIEADMSKYEVAASEATKWECGDGNGGTIELHRVFVRLKPKADGDRGRRGDDQGGG
jgi:hypothetical protein